jgi:hypothetical protein
MIVALLILLVILLGFTLIGALSLRNERGGVLVSAHEKRAQQAASACMEAAIDRLGRDEDYGGDETVDLGEGVTCEIRPIAGSGPWAVEAESRVGGATARYRAVLTSRCPVEIDSWSELEEF